MSKTPSLREVTLLIEEKQRVFLQSILVARGVYGRTPVVSRIRRRRPELAQQVIVARSVDESVAIQAWAIEDLICVRHGRDERRQVQAVRAKLDARLRKFGLDFAPENACVLLVPVGVADGNIENGVEGNRALSRAPSEPVAVRDVRVSR